MSPTNWSQQDNIADPKNQPVTTTVPPNLSSARQQNSQACYCGLNVPSLIQTAWDQERFRFLIFSYFKILDKYNEIFWGQETSLNTKFICCMHAACTQSEGGFAQQLIIRGQVSGFSSVACQLSESFGVWGTLQSEVSVRDAHLSSFSSFYFFQRRKEIYRVSNSPSHPGCKWWLPMLDYLTLLLLQGSCR